jgi:hypothetical protein
LRPLSAVWQWHLYGIVLRIFRGRQGWKNTEGFWLTVVFQSEFLKPVNHAEKEVLSDLLAHSLLLWDLSALLHALFEFIQKPVGPIGDSFF